MTSLPENRPGKPPFREVTDGIMEGNEIALDHLKQVWEEVTARPKEHFHYPAARIPGEWPADYAEILEIPPVHPMVEDPATAITTSAYLVNYEAARFMALVSKAQDLFQLQTPGQAREMASRCPELEAGLKPFYRAWQWLETTSGIYTVTEAEQQELHLRLMPGFMSNLIWKLKMQARAGTQAAGAPEPLLNLQTLREILVDIAYVPSWSRGAKSFFKKNIDMASANAFAEACTKTATEATPYTYAAACPACETVVTPGTLVDHLKECTLQDSAGRRLHCKCDKSFTTLAALSQHKVLHCRRSSICPGCGQEAKLPCPCQQRRTALCEEILTRIYQTERGTGNIFDLANETAVVATQEELVDLIKTMTDKERGTDRRPTSMVPIWQVMQLTAGEEETYQGRENISRIEIPGNEGDDGSDHLSQIDGDGLSDTGSDSHNGSQRMPFKKDPAEKCTLCDNTFPDLKQLLTHVESVHTTSFKCTLCGMKKKSAESLMRHLKCHSMCTYCDELFFEERDKEEHELKEHPGATSLFTCDMCEESHLTSDTLANHKSQQHPTCSTCGRRFDDQQTFADHLPCGQEQKDPRCGTCRVTFNTKATYLNHLPCRGPQGMAPPPQGIRCNFCPTDWPTQESLKHHTKTTHPECPTCNKTFKSVRDYINHTPCQRTERSRAPPPEVFKCEKCEAKFHTALALMEHDQQKHQRTPSSPQACLCCPAQVEEQAYMDHIRQHTKLYQWNLKGLTCPKCPEASLESIAETLEHMIASHREAFPGFTSAVRAEKEARRDLNEDKALVRAVRKAMGAEDDFKCDFENCRMVFFTSEELERHKKQHGCDTCGFQPNNPRELADHIKQHGKARTEGCFPCNKCGQKLSTYEELTAHEEAHNKYACGRCRQKFASIMEQNKHELTCGAVGSMDVFGAAASSDPTLVLAKCLQTMVSANAGSLEPGTADLMNDQIKKAISTQSGKTTLRKNHNSQKTFTFIKSPAFQPSNTVTVYSDKDISPLKTCQFAGTGTPEENFTTLNELVQNISRVVKARSLTKDIATDLLLQHLKSPARDLANSYKEEFELRYGTTAIPEFQDVLLYLETTFINIRPQHAREQLLALKRQPGESMTGFYIRAWRASHFASFTEKEADRPRFRESVVKEAIMRNLAPKQRENIDQEELQRGLRDEAPMGPREIIDYLNHLRSQKEALDTERARPDFTTVGQLAAKVRTTNREGHTTTGTKTRMGQTRGGGLKTNAPRKTHAKKNQDGQGAESYRRRDVRLVARTKTPKTTPARNVEAKVAPAGGRSREGDRREWIEAATTLAGQGACWKCTRRGHGHKECRTYKLLTRRPCPTCRRGYHHPKACRGKETAQRTPPPNTDGKRFVRPKPARYTWAKGQNQKNDLATGSNRVQPKDARTANRPATDGRWTTVQPDGQWPGKAKGPPTRKPFIKMNRVRKEQDLVEELLSGLRDKN